MKKTLVVIDRDSCSQAAVGSLPLLGGNTNARSTRSTRSSRSTRRRRRHAPGRGRAVSCHYATHCARRAASAPKIRSVRQWRALRYRPKFYFRYWWLAVARARRQGVEHPELLASKLMDSVLRCYSPRKGVKGRFEPYFNKAVRHRIASGLRAQWSRRQREVHLPEGFDFTLLVVGSQSSADPDLKEAVALASRKLHPSDRALMKLRFWDGYACADVAAITGLSSSAVASRLSRAYKRLRRSLARYAPARRTVAALPRFACRGTTSRVERRP